MNTNRRSPAQLIWLVGIATLYLGTRVPRLLSVPIFLDEAIHIHFAKGALAGALRGGEMLGKWLAIQAYGLFLRFFGDSLFSSRLVPVLLGLLTVILLFAIARTTRNRGATTSGGFSALLYAVVPFSLFYDRVALTDQFLTVLLALIFLFTLRITDKPSRLDQILLGLVIMLSPMFKFNGLLFVPIPIILAMVVTKRGERLRRLYSFALPFAFAMPVLLLFCLFTAPTSEAGKLFGLQSVDAWMQLVGQNVKDTLALFWSMLTPELFLGLVGGSIALATLSAQQDSRRRVLACIAVLIVLTLPYVLFFRCWYPRYHLPLLVPVCVIGGEVSLFVWSYVRVRRWSIPSVLSCALLFFVLAIPLTRSIQIVLAPQGYPYYKEIRSQFFSGWTSGYGLQEAVQTTNRLSAQHQKGVRILRSPKWDIPSYGLDVYYRELGPNTQRMTLQPWEPERVVTQISEVLGDGVPTYLLFNSAYFYPGDRDVIDSIRTCFDAQEVAHFEKPEGNQGLRLWRLNTILAGVSGERNGGE